MKISQEQARMLAVVQLHQVAATIHEWARRLVAAVRSAVAALAPLVELMRTARRLEQNLVWVARLDGRR